MKIKWTDLIIWVVATELVGALSALISGGNFSEFYSSLEQPPFAPPGWLFPVMWSILYALMGVSAYLIWESGNTRRKGAIILYGAQLFANFLWTPVFFGLKSLKGATVVVVIMLILITAMIISFLRINKTAAYLNLPYLFWTAFATYLTIGVTVLQ
ncbi:MAG: tryptophan-rich sensory protein [Ruminococcus sp.]|uniref:TspO/MBR family protein n=1 Tax=Ruminococcus sp. TaxID=41978 RepID=UPI0025F67DB0|nr:TspO/MBR family protein [Ruminococcus sp.]MBR5683105.1 tryptophan-rich sensory protein [Ruminococcus sp.]